MEKLNLFPKKKNLPVSGSIVNLQCKCCPRHKTRSNVILGEGMKNPRIMFILAQPSKATEEAGTTCSEDRKRIDKVIYDAGLNDESCYITYICKCGSSEVNRHDANECGELYLKREIEWIKPSIIAGIDSTAQTYLKNLNVQDVGRYNYDEMITNIRKACVYNHSYSYRIRFSVLAVIKDNSPVSICFNIENEEHLRGWAISDANGISRYFDIYEDQGEQTEDWIAYWGRFFESHYMIFYNGKPIIKALTSLFGWKFNYAWDVYAGEGFVHPSLNNSLESMSLRYLGEDIDSTDGGIKAENSAIAIRRIWTEQQKSISILSDTMDISRITLDMEMGGVKIDRILADKILEDYKHRMDTVSEEIYCCIGKINLNASDELKTALVRRIEKHNTGWADKLNKSIDEHTLSECDCAVTRDILSYRKSKKGYDAVKSIIDHTDPQGYVHTTYNINRTSTGRLTSENPNLHGIQHEGDIRKIFIASEGCSLVEFDYSHFEPRILAHRSQDKVLIEDLNRGFDIYKYMYSCIYGLDLERVTEIMRSKMKHVVLGIIYGMYYKTLASDLCISEEEAQGIVNDFYRRYYGVKRYIDNTICMARKNGYVKSSFGRVRKLPAINSSVFEERLLNERYAMNTPKSRVHRTGLRFWILRSENIPALRVKLVSHFHQRQRRSNHP